MKKKFSDKSAKFLKAFVPRGKGGSSGGGTPATTRPSTPTPTSVPGPATLAADPANHSITDPNFSQSPSGMSGTIPPDDQTIVQQVRNWWKAHRGTVLASAQFVLESVEKGLDGMPIPGPKAAIGAFAGVVKAVRTLDENQASVKEITEKLEELTGALAQFMAPTLPDIMTASVSEDMKIRVEEFNGRLTKIKTSAGTHPTAWKNVLVRLADTERVSEELKDAWTKIQVEYLHLITMTGLSTERKIDDVQRRLLLDRLKPALSALYDDAEAAPSCLKDTRVDVLAHIEGWMADPSGKPVYWLTGVAGTGKTTIAQSVAMMADAKERRCLFGSFFFSRTGAADRRSAAAVIPTLVYQLSLKNGLFCSRLCNAIDSEPDLFRKKVEVQARALLSDTCADIPSRLPYPLVIVIDALDECDKQRGNEASTLISVLLGALQRLPFLVKIFITSRPDASIENMFSRADFQEKSDGLALHRDIEDSIVHGDIRRYLRYELDELAVDHLKVTIPPSFPLEEQFVALQDRAGTLFIYARTALEFVKNPNTDPRRQIELLLSTDPRDASHGFGELDTLYMHVMSQALKHSGIKPQAVRDLLASLVILREQMKVAALAAINGIKKEDCQAIIRSLASVILYDHAFEESIRLIHLSFSDFLLDCDRSTDAHVVDVSAHHLRLAERCLRIMNECLRKDICEVGDPSPFNTEVTDLNQRLDCYVPPQLRYACRFWHVHLELAGTVSVGVASHLMDFCEKHLLHWLELLSLLDELPVVLASMTSFLAHLCRFEELQDAHALLSDVVRLAAAYQVPVTASALHVYHSAVVTMPSCRLQELASKDDVLPVLVSERPSSWQRILEGHSKRVESIAFSGDGRYIVSSSDDCTVRVWDVATGIQLHMMTAHGERVTSVAFFGDGKKLRVVSGSWDCTVRVWDAMTGAELHIMHHGRFAVHCVAVSRDDQLIASGSDDCTIRIWDAPTGTFQIVLRGHTGRVSSVAFSSNSKLVVSGSRDGTLRVWDAATGMQQLVISGHKDSVTYVAFSKDGRYIISGAYDATIRVWSTDTGTSVLTIDGPDNLGFSTPTSHSESLIASGFHDGTIRLWDATTGHLQRLIATGHEDWITSLAISDDGTFVVVGYENGPLWVSEITTSTNLQQRSQTAHTKEITSVAFSNDGMFVVSGSRDCTAKVWSARTGEEVSTLSGHTKAVTSVAFSGDGTLVVSGSIDRTVRLWDAKTGTELHVFAGHEDTVSSVALSNDNKLVASGSWDDTVRLWDGIAGTYLHTMSGHEGSVASVAFSDDSNLIISGSHDRSIRIWDAATGTHQQTITGYKGGYSVAFSNGSSCIVSRSTLGNGTMQVWEAGTAVALDGLSTSLPQYVEASDSPRCDQFKVDKDGWIHRLSPRNNWQRMCWLPSERRGGKFAYHGQIVCIGTTYGIITILDFLQVRPA